MLGECETAGDGIEYVPCDTLAESGADSIQSVSFLLCMNEVGLGKDGAARGNAGRLTLESIGQVTQLCGILQTQTARLLVEKRTRSRRAAGIGKEALVPAFFVQEDETELFCTDVEDGLYVRMHPSDRADEGDLLVDGLSEAEEPLPLRIDPELCDPLQRKTGEQPMKASVDVAVMERVAGFTDITCCIQKNTAYTGGSHVNAEEEVGRSWIADFLLWCSHRFRIS